MSNTTKYYSKGKLLLTGEYLVLKGAKALALPLNLGQSLIVKASGSNLIEWKTFELGKEIFSAKFNVENLNISASSNVLKAEYIQKLLQAAKQISHSFLNADNGFEINANIEFNMQWGLGTSSTLINNIAQWANINAFDLNNIVSKGSGYDIACAASETPITYQLINNKPTVNKVAFYPDFIDNICLVYLNKKMATEQNISKFIANYELENSSINQINTITEQIITYKSLNEFMNLMEEHEQVIARVVQQNPVKESLFPDFEGSIKSLGAWGGDFVLAASNNSFKKQQIFFNNKGYKTVIPLKSLMV